MALSWVLATLHLLGLGIGLGAIWSRARTLDGEQDLGSLRRIFQADSWWGLSALVWISTGLWRLLGAVENSTSYYLGNHLFLGKMGLLLLVLVLEVWPMVGLIRWRASLRRSEFPDVRRARSFARVSYVQTGLILLMVVFAAGMARGYGAGGS